MPNMRSSSLNSLSRTLFLFLFISFFMAPARMVESRTEPRIFVPLNDWLYRSSQPQDAEFASLKEKGIRTIVNFRDDSEWIEREKKKAEGLGMKYVSLPWKITRPVKPELLDRFFEVLDDPKNRPVLFHCEHGRDRSGVMAVLALMRYEKLSEKEARELALETYRPHLQYRLFVNQKIKFFLKSRPNAFPKPSPSSSS